ncbi:hypothetical protein, partial [Falsiroseomonas oryzae]|uniref:hypothetical protein n=1 Tax=Falsiroseomonas oryzae TaxID=2766473 RepID=UPI0022EA17EF
MTQDDARAPAPSRGLPGLRRQLFVLVVVVLLPALAFGAAATREALRRQDAAAEARLQDTAHALAAAVDARIAGHIAALRVLAASPDAVLDGDLGHFRQHARATAETFGSWVVVYESSGAQLLNTQRADAEALPGPGGAEGPRGGGHGIRAAFETGQPVVTDVAIGRVSGRPAAFVFVPILRNGGASRVLGMPLLPEHFAAGLEGQAAAGRGAVALTDAAGVVVAR